MVYGDDSFVDEDSLPELHMVKEDEEEPYEVTVFRPLVDSEKKKEIKI